MTDEIKAFAARYTEAWCSQEPSRVAEFFSPRGSLKVNDGAPAVGRDQIAAVARSFMTDFPDLAITMDRVIENGERTEYHWTLDGTYRANGRRVRVSGYESWAFGPDGLIESSLGRFDAADYQRQIS